MRDGLDRVASSFRCLDKEGKSKEAADQGLDQKSLRGAYTWGQALVAKSNFSTRFLPWGGVRGGTGIGSAGEGDARRL